MFFSSGYSCVGSTKLLRTLLSVHVVMAFVTTLYASCLILGYWNVMRWSTLSTRS